MTYDEFLKEVEERAGLEDRDEAERTAAVVLQTLSDRLVGGEANDLLARLPAPLKKAVVVTEEPAKMSPVEFVYRVANDLGVSDDQARKRIHVVFDVLRAAVTPGELDDVLARLPSSYAKLIA